MKRNVHLVNLFFKPITWQNTIFGVVIEFKKKPKN
jgi:hypothetical protein